MFLNRCDALDPALAWTGVKDSGRGVSLSEFGTSQLSSLDPDSGRLPLTLFLFVDLAGFDQLTRLKSVHMKTKIN